MSGGRATATVGDKLRARALAETGGAAGTTATVLLRKDGDDKGKNKEVVHKAENVRVGVDRAPSGSTPVSATVASQDDAKPRPTQDELGYSWGYALQEGHFSDTPLIPSDQRTLQCFNKPKVDTSSEGQIDVAALAGGSGSSSATKTMAKLDEITKRSEALFKAQQDSIGAFLCDACKFVGHAAVKSEFDGLKTQTNDKCGDMRLDTIVPLKASSPATKLEDIIKLTGIGTELKTTPIMNALSQAPSGCRVSLFHKVQKDVLCPDKGAFFVEQDGTHPSRHLKEVCGGNGPPGPEPLQTADLPFKSEYLVQTILTPKGGKELQSPDDMALSGQDCCLLPSKSYLEAMDEKGWSNTHSWEIQDFGSDSKAVLTFRIWQAADTRVQVPYATKPFTCPAW